MKKEQTSSVVKFVVETLRPKLILAVPLFILTLLSENVMSKVIENKTADLAYQTYGSGDEKVMVLHSWLDDSNSFNLVKNNWSPETYTFVFVELRGYGKSKNIHGNFSSTEAAKDVFHLAEKLEWNKFHLMGHSMSGMIVQRMALIDNQEKTNRLKSVIALNPVTANGYPADEETKGFLQGLIHNKELSIGLVQGMTGGKLPTAFYNELVENYMRINTVEAMKGYYNMWINEDFSSEIKNANIELPLLVVSGANDLPGFQYDFYKETFGSWYSNVEFVNIESAGHLPMYETPLLLAAAVESFLSANQ